MKRAVAYTRCSTDKQPLSLDDQRAEIERWAAASDVAIARWYVDDAISGASADDRKSFQRMVGDLEELRDAELVLCYDVSRFGRTDNDEAGFYRFKLRRAGAEVVYVAEAAVTGAATDDLLLPVLQYQKREALRALSRDTVRGLVGLASRGAWCGGPAPFGYLREVRDREGRGARQLAAGERAHTEDGSAVFLVAGSAADVAALRRVWDMRWIEGASLDRIRDELHRLGARPARAQAWRTSGVRAIVTNPVYTGRLTYGLRTQAKFHRADARGPQARSRQEAGLFRLGGEGEPVIVEGAHPPLASAEAIERFLAWERAARATRASGRTLRRGKDDGRPGRYLLTGLVSCAKCGHRFIVTTSSRRKGGEAYVYRDYVCSGYEGSGSRLCTRFAVPLEELEEVVVAEVRHRWHDHVDPTAVRERILAELGPSGDHAMDLRLRRELAQIDARMLAIVENLDPEHADVANQALHRLRQRKALIDADLAEAARRGQGEARAREVAEAAADLAGSLPALWERADGSERRNLLRCFVEGVTIEPHESVAVVRLWRLPAIQVGPGKQTGSARSPSPSRSTCWNGSGGPLRYQLAPADVVPVAVPIRCRGRRPPSAPNRPKGWP